MSAAKLIAVEGPIGIGKSMLVRLLAKKLKGFAQLEEKNPFLQKFYADRQSHALQTQLFFLLSRYQQLFNLRQGDLFKKDVICDYLFEKDSIFARLNLDHDELTLYNKIYEMLGERVRRPDLVIYLYADLEIIEERLAKKREEAKVELPPIAEDYLKEVVEAYNQFFFDYNLSPLLVVNTNYLDFAKRKSDLDELVKKLETVSSGTNYWIPMINEFS